MPELKEFVGARGKPTAPRHPVNEPMIAHWCDAMGDENPCYTDAGFAASSVHGGIVAPPAMLDVWDRPGLIFSRDGASPRVGVFGELFARGFDSIVAVNTELEFARYLRPGESVSNTEIMDDISPEKRTARGPGHFVTTRHRFVNQDGEHVGDLMFRILVFRPEAREAPPEAAASQVPSDPALRPKPSINKDNEFFWDGCRRRELRIQKCTGCGALHAPPGPRCDRCGSFAMDWLVAAGKATLYSYAVPEHPKVPGFEYPLPVVLVELAEGTRLVGNIVGLGADELEIGMPLELTWLATDDIALPQWGAVSPPHRTDTATIEELSPGQAMPLCSLPITPTLVVAGAIATRDYTPVHHDLAVAKREGSKDIFMNINTSVGLIQRVVTDCYGPEIVFRAIRTRLGAPAYPGDLLTFRGHVGEVDEVTGNATVHLKGSDSYGDHAVSTVELTLPRAGGGR